MLSPALFQNLKNEATLKKTPAARKLELALMDVKLARVIAKHKNTPAEVLEGLLLSGDLATLTGVAMNPHALPEHLTRLSTDKRWKIRAQVASHPSTPPDVQERLARDVQSQVRLGVARGLQTPSHVLQAFLLDGDAAVQHTALGRLSLEEHVRLLREGDLPLRTVLIHHLPAKALVEDVLRCLLQDPAEEVRGGLALRKDVPTRVLHELREDPSPHVRACWAANPTTGLQEAHAIFIVSAPEDRWLFGNREDFSPEMLSVLVHHPDPLVRIKLARWKWTPPELLRVLARDPGVGVLEAVVAQKNTPPEALTGMLAHPDIEGVRQEWSVHPNTPYPLVEKWIEDTQGKDLRWFHPEMPLETVLEIAGKRGWSHLSHKNVPLEVLREKMKDPGWHADIARNPNLTEDLIRELWTSVHIDRPQVLLSGHPNLPLDLQLEGCKNPNWYTRMMLAASPHMYPQALEVLCQDPHAFVRSAVIDNPALPDGLLESLQDDADALVRDKARKLRVLRSLYPLSLA